MHSSLQAMIDEAKRTADKRRSRRIILPLKVRYISTDKEEHRGRVLNISSQGALIRALPGVHHGDRVLLYIDKLGRFSGEALRIERDGFAVKFNLKKERKQRLADKLIWLLNGGENEFNRRRAQRIRQNKPAIAVLQDASNRPCTILDISMTGASLAITPKPPIGDRITVGRMTAEVVRHHDRGVGVMFTTPAEEQR